MVTTAPCLGELLRTNTLTIKNDKLKCIAFENLDSIMVNHAEIITNIIAPELCLRKSCKEPRQIIVTSRTWTKTLKSFLNDKLDPVLLIGNYFEAAQYAGSFEFVMCKNAEKDRVFSGNFFEIFVIESSSYLF